MKLLYDLQEVDSALGRLRAKRGSSPEQERAAASAERYEKVVAARRLAALALAKQENALKGCEHELASALERIKRLNAKIYGGEVTNPKELRSLEERLGAEERKRDALEESVLEAMEELDRCRARLDKVERLLPKVESERDEARAALERALAEWNAEISRLEERRRSLASAAEPASVKAYESLYSATGGRPVAKVVARTCDGCHVTLPTGARAGETSRCPHCGRLLWWPS